MALVHKGKKNEAKAIELLKKALAANPDYWHARYELEQLEKKAPLAPNSGSRLLF